MGSLYPPRAPSSESNFAFERAQPPPRPRDPGTGCICHGALEGWGSRHVALGGLFSLGVGGTPLLPWSTLGCLEPSWLQMGAPAPHLTGYLVFGSLSSASIWFFGVQGLAPSHRMARGSQQHIHLRIGYLPSYLRSERQRHS